ncbi:MAG: hypothetical protein RSH26_05535 [Clostridia bacterium]
MRTGAVTPHGETVVDLSGSLSQCMQRYTLGLGAYVYEMKAVSGAEAERFA